MFLQKIITITATNLRLPVSVGILQEMTRETRVTAEAITPRLLPLHRATVPVILLPVLSADPDAEIKYQLPNFSVAQMSI
jgi:hypothetical protein